VGKGPLKGATTLLPFRDSGPQSGPCSSHLVLLFFAELPPLAYLAPKGKLEQSHCRASWLRASPGGLGAMPVAAKALAHPCVWKRGQRLMPLLIHLSREAEGARALNLNSHS